MRYTLTKLMSAFLLVGATFASFATDSASSVSVSSTSPSGMTPTFFRPRNVTTDSTFELALENYNMFHNPSQCWGDFYARPFYQRSFYGAQTARYFLPSGNDRMRLSNENGDVSPLWLRIIAPTAVPPAAQIEYHSEVAINPLRETFGAIFTLNLYPWDCLFFNVHFAVMEARHNLRVAESSRIIDGIDAPPGLFPNFCAAMNAADMTAGKIACTGTKASGVDDVQFKLGYNFIDTDNGHLMAYLVGTAPTGKKSLFNSIVSTDAVAVSDGSSTDEVKPVQGAEFLFQPVVGSRQGSFGAGINADMLMYCQDDRSMWLMMDAKVNYYFSATERRTFDLYMAGNTEVAGRNWSRYLLLADSAVSLFAEFPAINTLTQDAKVRPGVQFQYWSAAHFEYCMWQFEAGYNFWFRQQERVSLLANSAFPTTFGIYDIAGVLAGVPTSSSNAAIFVGADNPSDAAFVALTIEDLNPTSAAHPRTASSKFYGSVGRNFELCDHFAGHFGVNASVEFAHNYAALNQYGVWATAALLF